MKTSKLLMSILAILAILVAILFSWLLRDGPIESNFVRGGVEGHANGTGLSSQKCATSDRSVDESIGLTKPSESSVAVPLAAISGVSAPPSGNFPASEWLPNPDRPLRPQLAIYAASEPVKAAAIALAIPCEEEDPEANDPLRAVVQAWAKINPDDATLFYDQMTDPQRRLGAALGLVEGLAENDVERAASWVGRQVQHRHLDAVAFISLVVPHMQPARAGRWLATLPLDHDARELTKGLVAPKLPGNKSN